MCAIKFIRNAILANISLRFEIKDYLIENINNLESLMEIYE